MIEKYHDPILKAITEAGGALGVNTIAKTTGYPLSTIQKYLDKQQHYFKKTHDRKWDLPERVTNTVQEHSLVLMVNAVENAILLLQSQIEEIKVGLGNALTPISTLKRGINTIQPSVANKTGIENSELAEALESLDKLPSIFKSKKENLPEGYLELLLNTKWLELFMDLGRNYFIEYVQSELYDLLLGNQSELSEEVLSNIKEYQK